MLNFNDFFKNNPDKQIVNMYLSNPKMHISEIAYKTNKSIGEIYRILKNNEINPNRLKIHHEKVENLARLGWSIKEIAEITGYSTRNVRYILKGKL
jgi:AraC-like DNA-binding protein